MSNRVTIITVQAKPEDFEDSHADLIDLWAWPVGWAGEIYCVKDCPQLYFRLWTAEGITDETEYVEVGDLLGDSQDSRIWRITERHPTEDAVLGVWPD